MHPYTKCHGRALRSPNQAISIHVLVQNVVNGSGMAAISIHLKQYVVVMNSDKKNLYEAVYGHMNGDGYDPLQRRPQASALRSPNLAISIQIIFTCSIRGLVSV